MENVAQDLDLDENTCDHKLSAAKQSLQQAVALINNDMISEAVEVLTGVLDVYMDRYGETALECAPLFFRYGQALLFQAQDTHKNSHSHKDCEDKLSNEYSSDADECSGSSSDEDECEYEQQLEGEEIIEGFVQECRGKQDGCKQQSSGKKGKENEDEYQVQQEEGEEIIECVVQERQGKYDGCKLPSQGKKEIEVSCSQDSHNDKASSSNKLVQQDQSLSKNDDEEEQNSDSEKAESVISDGIEADLQSAWEYLETARHIYETNGGSAMYEAELAEILTCLGDVSSEREDFETALGDYKRALSLYKALAELDGNIVTRMKKRRRVAETNFKLALAMQFTFRYTDADHQISSALDTLKKLAAELNVLDEIDVEVKQKNLDDIQGSIDDLQAYQRDLKQLSDAGGLARIKSAIEAAQKVAACDEQSPCPHAYEVQYAAEKENQDTYDEKNTDTQQAQEEQETSKKVDKQKAQEKQEASKKRKLQEVLNSEGQLKTSIIK